MPGRARYKRRHFNATWDKCKVRSTSSILVRLVVITRKDLLEEVTLLIRFGARADEGE